MMIKLNILLYNMTFNYVMINIKGQKFLCNQLKTLCYSQDFRIFKYALLFQCFKNVC